MYLSMKFKNFNIKTKSVQKHYSQYTRLGTYTYACMIYK